MPSLYLSLSIHPVRGGGALPFAKSTYSIRYAISGDRVAVWGLGWDSVGPALEKNRRRLPALWCPPPKPLSMSRAFM